MGNFEKKIIYQFIKGFLLSILRYSDHISFIWRGNKTDLEKILNELNTKRPSIKFEYVILKERKIPKHTLKRTNYIPKYLERKKTVNSFLTSTQSN